MKLTQWSERQLSFGKGLDELPYLLERMRGMPARTAELLKGMPIECLVMQQQGRWSAMGHLAHMLLLDQRFQARIDDFERRRPALCRIGLEDQDEQIERACGRQPGDLLEEARLTRLNLVSRLTAMDEAALRHRAAHPCMGAAMSPVDMATWISEHDDHHLLAMRIALGARFND
jgi:hypothetical protein